MNNLDLCLNRNNGYESLPYEQKVTEIAAINSLLLSYGLKVTRMIESPRMIQYRAQLTPDTNTKKLLKMSENFCIALNDDSVNIFREKSELVIEKRGADNTIFMGDIVTDYFRTSVAPLTVMLGKDAEGNNVYVDLAKTPHVLVAGATGSGKSVTLNTIMASLLVRNVPVDIFTVDTKGTELCGYKNVSNVHAITDPEEAIKHLAYLCKRMDDRYAFMAKYGYRDIESVRAAGIKVNSIVVIIDEFADLMLLSGKSVEQYVVRLAQKARAAGIHLVIATQRPTRDVVTGLIKANIPTRICLKVTSGLESRIILDRNGGEKLTGHGDMLYLANGAFEPIRVQGCFISESEVEALRKALTANIKEESVGVEPQERKLPPQRYYEPPKSLFQKLFKK